MVLATTEKLLKAELKDILNDITDLNSISLELQFQNEDVIQYRYWLKNSLTYLILARNILGAKPEYNFYVREVNGYCDRGDLSELTTRLHQSFKRTLLVYSPELDDSLNHILNTIEQCLIKMCEYANKSR